MREWREGGRGEGGEGRWRAKREKGEEMGVGRDVGKDIWLERKMIIGMGSHDQSLIGKVARSV